MKPLNIEITAENQHAVTIDATKTTIELPSGDNRKVHNVYQSIVDGGLHICVSIEDEPLVVVEEKPTKDATYERIKQWLQQPIVHVKPMPHCVQITADTSPCPREAGDFLFANIEKVDDTFVTDRQLRDAITAAIRPLGYKLHCTLTKRQTRRMLDGMDEIAKRAGV